MKNDIVSKEKEIRKSNYEDNSHDSDIIPPSFRDVSTDKTKDIYNDDILIDLSTFDDIDMDFSEVEDSKTLSNLNEIYRHMADDLKKINDETGKETSLDDLTKNEEFLQSLKDFRKKL